ncbi:hypothetical protein [Serinibacter arcticus]|uniref:Uncharacterized protein n=1 Tax=Serinibacter arcticus TaxID=1655435 RepID=A0A4Z1E3B7_9MICO|nr:hypothetical protein [Serinibacter arcticus]TGO06426.1 hypothetical protein SERN_0618 [Serinibacter arcticus]
MRTLGGSARTTTTTAGASATALVTTALLAACGAPDGTDGTPGDGAVEYEVVAGFEERDGGGVVLCIGPMPAIYPAPPCGGPRVDGLDWDDVPGATTVDGTTSGRGYLVGTYADRTLTLTRTPAAEPPGSAAPSDEWGTVSFDALCTDPWRGGDEAAAAEPEAAEAQNDLVAAAAALPGYVTTYVSDGAQQLNVVVSADEGDADAAHASLREVWPGWLCVAEKDLPTSQDVAAAQSAVHGSDGVSGVMSSGSGVDGVLAVDVEVADTATVAAIEEAVSPWLTPAQVRVTGALRPVS